MAESLPKPSKLLLIVIRSSVHAAPAHSPKLIVCEGDRVARERAVNRGEASGSRLSGGNVGIERLADSILHLGDAWIGRVPLPVYGRRSPISV